MSGVTYDVVCTGDGAVRSPTTRRDCHFSQRAGTARGSFARKMRATQVTRLRRCPGCACRRGSATPGAAPVAAGSMRIHGYLGEIRVAAQQLIAAVTFEDDARVPWLATCVHDVQRGTRTTRPALLVPDQVIDERSGRRSGCGRTMDTCSSSCQKRTPLDPRVLIHRALPGCESEKTRKSLAAPDVALQPHLAGGPQGDAIHGGRIHATAQTYAGRDVVTQAEPHGVGQQVARNSATRSSNRRGTSITLLQHVPPACQTPRAEK